MSKYSLYCKRIASFHLKCTSPRRQVALYLLVLLFTERFSDNGTVEEKHMKYAKQLMESILEHNNNREHVDFHIKNGIDAYFGTGGIEGNLYDITASDQVNMLEAYHTLYENTPLIKEGHEALNQSIVNLINENTELHIIDAGIGFGKQWEILFRQLKVKPKKLTITGIDLEMGMDHLKPIGERLNQLANEYEVNFEFIPLYGEFEKLNLKELIKSPNAKLVVNMSLFLHHIIPEECLSNQSLGGRNSVMRRVKQLQPDLITLLEPDSDHNSLNFEQTLVEARRHYGEIFRVLDICISDQTIRRIIKDKFFGREIFNILGCEGAERVERHERYKQWQQRLMNIGFTELSVCDERHSKAHRIGPGKVKLLTAMAWC